jgi:uncharacterized membrane protein YdjX (TVP38/TMEM64 family)
MGLADFLVRWIGASLGILAAATLAYLIYRRLRHALRRWRARMRHRRASRRVASAAPAPPPVETASAPDDSER